MTEVEDLAGRPELIELVASLVPSAWLEAAESGAEAELDAHKRAADNPAIVRALGEAGWVAPHFPIDAGGRGMDRDNARAAYRFLDMGDPPHPEGFRDAARRADDSRVGER